MVILNSTHKWHSGRYRSTALISGNFNIQVHQWIHEQGVRSGVITTIDVVSNQCYFVDVEKACVVVIGVSWAYQV